MRISPNRHVPVLIVILFLCGFSLGAEESRLIVIPIITSGVDEELSEAAVSMTAAIEQSVELLTEYEVLDPPDYDPVTELETIKEWVRIRKIDLVLFGTFTRNQDQWDIMLSSYDSSRDEVVISLSDSISSRDNLLSGIVTLVETFMEELSGSPVNFGAVSLEPQGQSDASYSVYIDNIYFGNENNNIHYLPEGEHRIVILQERFGELYTLYDKWLDIPAKPKTEISFSIPLLSTEEQMLLTQLKNKLQFGIENPEEWDLVEETFRKAELLLKSIEFAPGLSEEQDEFQFLKTKWLLYKERQNIINSFTPELSILDETLRLYELYRDLDQFNEIKKMAKENAGLQAHIINLYATIALEQEEWEQVVEYYRAIEETARIIPDYSYYGFKEDTSRILRLLSNIDEIRNGKKNYALPGVATGFGVVFTGLSLWLFSSDYPNTLVEEADDMYQLYQNSSDPVLLEELHAEITSRYIWGEVLQWTKWSSVILGPASIIGGIAGFILEEPEAKKDAEEGIEEVIPKENYADEEILLPPAAGFSSVLIVSDARVCPVKINGEDIGNTPVYLTEYKPGDVISVNSGDSWFRWEPREMILREGRNMIIIPDEMNSQYVVRNPSGSYTDDEILLQWDFLTGAEDYIIQVCEGEEEFQHGLYEEFSTGREEIEIPWDKDTPFVFRVRAVNSNKVRGPWSRIAGSSP